MSGSIRIISTAHSSQMDFLGHPLTDRVEYHVSVNDHKGDNYSFKVDLIHTSSEGGFDDAGNPIDANYWAAHLCANARGMEWLAKYPGILTGIAEIDGGGCCDAWQARFEDVLSHETQLPIAAS